ncbi:MAG: class I SAM-dependent methyltransferase [Thermoplasmata archaeon]
MARRYAALRRSGSQIEDWKKQAAEMTSSLPDGARILEVAPGPGYFAIELARLGRFQVSGLDISHTFVGIEKENSLQSGVSVDFRQGDAARMPFADGSFDLIITQAAFKNFSRPNQAINEMHRVLRAGGVAVIQDMTRNATNDGIRHEVEAMRLGWFGALMTRAILRRLRRRAYTPENLEMMARASAFRGCEISTSGIGLEAQLRKTGSH